MQTLRLDFFKYVSLNIMGMIGLSCYILADTFFVAQGVGTDGLAALNIAIPAYSFIHGTGLMIGMGGATRFAITKSNDAFTQACFMAVIGSVLFSAGGIFCPEFIAKMLGADAVTLYNTGTYLRVILSFSPLFLLNNIIICFVRNDGAPKLAMAAMLFGSFSNIVLDYLFLFPIRMGMFGAALATGIAPLVSISILSVHFLKKRNTFRVLKSRIYLKKIGDICALGFPAFMNEVAAGVIMIVFNGILLNLEGNTGVAAYGIIANIALVAFSVFTGIAQGVQPIISREFSKNNLKAVKRLIGYGVITAIAIAAFIYALVFLFAEPITDLFNKEQSAALSEIAVYGIRLYFTAILFTGLNITAASCFCSLDRAKNALILSLLRGLFLIIPTAIGFSLAWGITGLWLATPVTEFVVLVLSLFMMRRIWISAT